MAQTPPTIKLPPRQIQVLRFLAQGFVSKEIADVLGLSVKTVETYRTRLCEKLGLKTRAGLFHYAWDAGMLTADQLAKSVPGYSTPTAKSKATSK